MSKALNSKVFRKVLVVAAVGAMLYMGGAAIAANMSAGTAAGVAGTTGTTAAAGATGATGATAATAAAGATGAGPALASTGASSSGGFSSLMAAAGKTGADATLISAGLSSPVAVAPATAAASGFLSSPLAQASLVQTGGAMLQGGFSEDPPNARQQYQAQGALTGVTATPESYYYPESDANSRSPQGPSKQGGMPAYNRDTKRWEST